MKAVGSVWFLSASVLAVVLKAGPAEVAIVAAMKVSEAPNYTWACFVQDDTRSYEVDGKCVRNGLTWVRMPMIDSVAARLGRDVDYHLEAFFKGNLSGVIRTEQGWKTVKELPRPARRDYDDGYFTGSTPAD